MHVHNLKQMLQTEKFEETLSFYTDVLGFEIVNKMDRDGVLFWASLRIGSAGIMFSTPDEHTEFRPSSLPALFIFT